MRIITIGLQNIDEPLSKTSVACMRPIVALGIVPEAAMALGERPAANQQGEECNRESLTVIIWQVGFERIQFIRVLEY